MESTITLLCPVCDVSFEQRLATYNYQLKQTPDRKFYCSSAHSKLGRRKPLEEKICKGCNSTFTRKKTGVNDKLLFCSRACGNKTTKTATKLHCKWCATEIPSRRKVCDECLSGKTIENETLDFIKEHYSTSSFHSRIRSHSRRLFLAANPDVKCHFCEYNLYIEVAHIKPVSAFQGDSKLSEVNDLSNLVGLCRNHHWELDHGYISIETDN